MIWLHRIRFRYRGLRLRVRFLLRKAETERELDDELQFHLESAIEEFLAAGMTEKEARRQALLAFGGTERFKEQVREARGVRPLENLIQDVRYAVRQFRKHWTFSTVAVLTLALGVGANTAIFTLVHSLILDPLPFEGGDRLVQLWRQGEELGRVTTFTPTQKMAAAWATESRSFDAFEAFDEAELLFIGSDGPVTLNGAMVSPGLLNLMATVPLVGRLFSPDEDAPGNHRVVLLSESLWRSRFGADPQVVGRIIQLNEEPHEIVGVLPARVRQFFEGGFFSTQPKELWTPLLREGDGGWASGPYVVARLRPGVHPRSALAELEVIQAQLEYEGVDEIDWRPQIVTASEALDQDLSQGLWVLLGAVGFVLLIACANISNLIWARNLQRAHEFAVRRSLGAGSARVVRQLFTEGLVLGGMGAALGLVLASWTIAGVAGTLGATIPELRAARMSPTVFGVALALVFLSTLLFSLLPALGQRRARAGELARSASRATTGPRRLALFTSGLVVAEVALAMALILGAGLLLNSYRRLQGVDPGFDPDNLLSLSMTLPESRYPDRAARIVFWDELTARVSQLPQVQDVSWSRIVPPLRLGTLGTVRVEGRPESDDPEGNPVHAGNWVSPNYFETLGLRVREGRTFSEQEMADPTSPIIINRTIAQQFWPEGGAVGSRIQLKSPLNPDWPSPWLNVVGVVDDVQAWGLGDTPDRFQLYMPITQIVRPDGILLVRTAVDPEAMIPVLEEQIWSVDPLLPIQDARLVRDRLLGSVDRDRFNALLLTAFAVLGLCLAAVGVYGVVSLSVGQRTREIGIRTALGAGRSQIIRSVMGRVALAVCAGLLLGLALARILSRVLEGLLFGIETTDPGTHVLVLALMTAVAITACLIPALKAMTVDPREALLEE